MIGVDIILVLARYISKREHKMIKLFDRRVILVLKDKLIDIRESRIMIPMGLAIKSINPLSSDMLRLYLFIH